MFRYIRQEFAKPIDTYTKVMGPPMVALIGYGYYQTFTNNNIRIVKPVANPNRSSKQNKRSCS